MRKYFVTGLLTILPLSLSLYVLFIIFKLVDNILGRFLTVYLKKTLGFYVPGVGFVLFILIIFVVGFLSTHIFGLGMHRFFNRAIGRFPLLKYIYPSLSKIFEFIFADNKMGFKKAVLVEYPSKGIWSLGFIANDGYHEAEEKAGKAFYNIYVPSSPNPTTGYFLLIPRDQVMHLDISIKEAMRLVMSGGLLNPVEFTKDS